MTPRTTAAAVRCSATVTAIDGATILRLPEPASRALPSRGQVAVHGTINGHPFDTVVEPDGTFGHWIRLDRGLQRATGLAAGDGAELTLEPRDDWPEPDVPADLRAALDAAPPEIQEMWRDITSMARWEWVRWVNATASPQTRSRRVEVTISKMEHGKRRPCCFNLASCTDPQLSRSGRLRPPD